MSKDLEIERRIDWHQTKGLSISIILLLLVNIVSTVWWAATLTNDVAVLKSEAISRSVPALTERVIKLEAITQEYNKGLNRIISLIEKLEQKLENVNIKVHRIDREQSRRKSSIHIHKRN